MPDQSSTDLTDDENQAVQRLAKFDARYVTHDSTSLTLERPHVRSPKTLIQTEVPRSIIPSILGQLEHEVLENSSLMGFSIPAIGYTELMVNSAYRIPDYVARAVFQLQGDDMECAHKDDGRALPSMPYRSLSRDRDNDEAHDDMVNPKLHVAKSVNGPCIEISNASPLAILLYARTFFAWSRLSLSIKIDYGITLKADTIQVKGESLARSFLYELDVRNGRALNLWTRPQPDEHLSAFRSVTHRTTKVRYPETPIRHEAAELFNFASQARYSNSLLAFLSYYQVLEHFLPAAASKDIVDKLRRELRQPSFDREDDSYLRRLVNAVERHAKLPESEHLRTLVSEYVRGDSLEEFFNADWGKYFTRRGPIRGVASIDRTHPAGGLANQVADRIYQIRNRIVHAKDDPRFEEARLLLPHSREADALEPDVELARLLASETIIACQDRGANLTIAN